MSNCKHDDTLEQSSGDSFLRRLYVNLKCILDVTRPQPESQTAQNGNRPTPKANKVPGIFKLRLAQAASNGTAGSYFLSMPYQHRSALHSPQPHSSNVKQALSLRKTAVFF